MQITYLGHSCYLLRGDNAVTVLTDPYSGVGYEMPENITADIVTVSHGHFDHCFTDGVKAKSIVRTAGKSVVEGIEIFGYETSHDEVGGAKRGKNIVFKFQLDGVTVCHLGDIGEPCSEELVNKLGAVDVLMIPVGGNYTVDAKGAKAYIDVISPKVALLMHYRPKDGAIDIADEASVLRDFENCTVQKNGVLDFNESTKGIILMERVCV